MSTPGYTQYGDRPPQAGPAQPYAAQYPGNPTGGPAYPGGIPQLYGGVGTEASKRRSGCLLLRDRDLGGDPPDHRRDGLDDSEFDRREYLRRGV